MDPFLLFVLIGVTFVLVTSYYTSYYLFRQYRRTRLLIILLWSTAFAFMAHGLLFLFLGIVYPIYNGLDEGVMMAFFTVGMLCFIFMVVFTEIFLIYVEYGGVKPRLYHVTVIGTFAGCFIGTLLAPSLFWLREFDSPQVYFVSIRFPALLIGGIFILYFAILYGKIFGRMLKENLKTPLRRKFIYLLSGLLITTVGLLVTQTLGILVNLLYINMVYPYVAGIGTILFLIGLKMDENYLIYLKQKVYRLVVFRQGGELLYIYRFQGLSTKEETYIVASIMGVTSFLQATLGVKENPFFDAIDVGNVEMICEFKEKIGFALIISEDSLILRQALHHVVQEFTAEKIFDAQHLSSIQDFETQLLPHLNRIVEGIFFFFPEKEGQVQSTSLHPSGGRPA